MTKKKKQSWLTREIKLLGIGIDTYEFMILPKRDRIKIRINTFVICAVVIVMFAAVIWGSVEIGRWLNIRIVTGNKSN